MKLLRGYRILRINQKTKTALAEVANNAGMSVDDLANFALNRVLVLFRNFGSEAVLELGDAVDNSLDNPLSAQVDLSKLSQETINWLSAEAQRRDCALGEIAGQSLEAWFGYISSDDAATKSIKCPGCGGEIKVLTS